MSPGYGEKIYTRRPARHRWFRLFIPLILMAAGLVWIIIRPQTPPAPTQDLMPAMNEPGPAVTSEDHPAPDPDPVSKDSPSRNNPASLSAPQAEKTINGEEMALAQGRSLLENRKYPEIISLLLPLANRNPQASLLVAEACYGLKKYTESKEMFERYLEKDPNNLAVIRRLVSTCYALNMLDEALRWCDRGLELAENDPELLALNRELTREQSTASKFISRESEHFVVTFDRGEHADARQQVLSILENAYRDVGRELGVYPERRIPVILYTRKAFFDVTRAPGWAGGLYDGKIRLPIASLSDHEEELTRILTHEYVHATVHQITDQCPRWINEGLAELFSQSDTPDIGQIIPLANMENGFPSAPDQAVAVAYAQSHAAVAYLIDRYSLSDLISLLKKLGEGSDFRSAFRDVYIIELNDFLSTWGV